MSPATQTIRFASAVSDEDETSEALDEALGPIADGLKDAATIDLVLVFATAHHARAFPKIAERVRRQFNPRIALGASAAGVIGTGCELERGAGLSVLAAQLPGVSLNAFSTTHLDWPASSTDPGGLRRAVTGSVVADPKALVLLGDPFSLPLVKLLPALNEAMEGVPIVGGMASAGANPGENRLLLGDRVLREGGVGLAIGGNILVDCTVSQGCRAIGRPWVITKAHDNVILELGGKNPLRVYHEMTETLEAEDRQLLEEGVLIGRVVSEYKERFGRGDFLIRNLMGYDPSTGAIAVADLVHAGQTVQFHVRDAKTAEEDLRLLLETQKLHTTPAAGAVVCNCNGRGTHMFAKPNTEAGLIADALNRAPLAGFFAAGEIGPIGGQSFVHGFTSSMAVFRAPE